MVVIVCDDPVERDPTHVIDETPMAYKDTSR